MKKNNVKTSIIQNTKELIIKKASELFADSGYLGVSMEDIAKQLSITKAALYYHFTGKEQLYSSVLDDVYSSMNKKLNAVNTEQDSLKVLEDYIKFYIDFTLQEKTLLKVLLPRVMMENVEMKKRIISIRDIFLEKVNYYLREIKQSKYQRNKKSLENDSLMIMYFIEGLLFDNLMMNNKINSSKMARMIVTKIIS